MNIRQLPQSASMTSPVAVLGIFLANGVAASSADRCHSLRSLDSATGGAPIAPPLKDGAKKPTSDGSTTKNLPRRLFHRRGIFMKISKEKKSILEYDSNQFADQSILPVLCNIAV